MKRVLLILLLSAQGILMTGSSQTPRTVTLQALRGQHRVLLVFANGNNSLAEEQLTAAAGHADGFRERDMLLVGLSGTNPAVPAAMLSAADEAAARKYYHVAPGQFTVLLIGKDGGEKMRSHHPIAWERLQSTIDAMPMRRDEMRQGSKE